MDSLNYFKIDLRANNQITITRQRLAKKKEPRYEKASSVRLSQDEINSLIERYATQEGLDTSKRWYDPKRRIVPKVGNVSTSRDAALLLDIMNRFQRGNDGERRNEKKIKLGYGATPRVKNFTHRAAQKLRESGASVDVLCEGEPSKCRVITLTLPASGEPAYKALSDWSGYATNRLLQLIRRERDDLYHWFYVWEHQKRGALHMHICLYHENSELSRILGEKLVSKWRDILCDISRFSGVDLLHSKGFRRRVESHEMQSNNQEMRKGCGSYFAKYAGKTSRSRETRIVEDANTINARLYPPSSFWGRSQNLAKLCKSLSFHYHYEGIDSTESEELQYESLEILSQVGIVMNHSFSFRKEINYKGNGSLTIAEGESHVFYVSPSDYQHLLAHYKFVFSSRPTCKIPERSLSRPNPDPVTVFDEVF